MQGLPVDGGDDGIAEIPTGSEGDLRETGGDLGFLDPRLGHPHGCQMHVHGDIDGLLDLVDLFGTLDGSHLDDGPDQVQGCAGIEAFERQSQQSMELQAVFRAVRWEEADRALLGTLQVGCQGRGGCGLGNAHQGGQLRHRGQVARPHDVFDGQIVAEEHRTVPIQVDHSGIAWLVDAEVVQEGAVLPEGVRVVRVVHRTVVVA